MTDDEIRVHHLDVARHGNVTSGDSARTSSRKLKTLGAFAFHLQRDLFDVQNDVGDIFTHASKRREFVQHILDLDRRNCCALQR